MPEAAPAPAVAAPPAAAPATDASAAPADAPTIPDQADAAEGAAETSLDRARKASAKLLAKRRGQAQLAGEHERQVQAATARATAAEQRVQAAEVELAELRPLKGDGRAILRALMAQGVPPDEVRALLESGAVAQDPAARAVRAELDALKAAQQQQQTERQQAQRRAALERAEQAVTSTAADASKYPMLAALPPLFVLGAAHRYAAQGRQALLDRGVDAHYNDTEILDYLEAQYAAHTPQAAAGGQRQAPPTAATPASKQPSPPARKLTNGGASVPPVFDSAAYEKMTPHQQQKYDAKFLAETLKPLKK